MQQKEIRTTRRKARQALSESEKAQKSALICQQITNHPAYRRATRVAAYLAMPEEVNVDGVIKAALDDNKAVYLPVVIGWGQALKFARYEHNSELVDDCLGIKIPNVPASEYISAESLDFVVTPLVAFDDTRNRIGMGGGFYDRTFAFKSSSSCNTTLAGVAFEAQRSDTPIAANDWDICPDLIVSERMIY